MGLRAVLGARELNVSEATRPLVFSDSDSDVFDGGERCEELFDAVSMGLEGKVADEEGGHSVLSRLGLVATGCLA